MPSAHIIGICGRYSAGIAKLLKSQGWQVTGSDQGAYPPLTDYLKKNHIPFCQPYDARHINKSLNLVIVAGNALHVNPQNPEYLKAQKLGLKIISAAEILRDFVIKPESIVVAGAYAKTTITALLVKIFVQAGLDPSYKIGDLSLDFPDFIHTTNSQYSIAEGDEHPTLGYSPKPKFHYYPTKYLLLTSALWDHYNIYPTEPEYVKTFKTTVQKLPQNGLLLASLEGANNQQVVNVANCPVYRYSANNSQADFYASNAQLQESHTAFTFHEPHSSFPVKLPLLGSHNIENAVAAIAMARLHKINPRPIQQALSTFRGLKRRLELVATVHDTQIYHDQGQLPIKIQATLTALRQRFPQNKIFAILDPHASVLRHHQSLHYYHHTFTPVDQVIIARVLLQKLKKGQSPRHRVTGCRIANAIKKTQPQVKYLPLDSQILNFLKEHVQPNDILVFFSSGSFRTLIPDTIQMLKTNKLPKSNN